MRVKIFYLLFCLPCCGFFNQKAKMQAVLFYADNSQGTYIINNDQDSSLSHVSPYSKRIAFVSNSQLLFPAYPISK
jgi:hypothetical protein